MTRSEYQELTDFFVAQLDRVQAEIKTFVGVTVDALRSDVRAVADGVLTNGRRIDGLISTVDTLTLRVDGLTLRVDGLTLRVHDMNSRLDDLTLRVDGLNPRVHG
jgi:hypothetical protein